MDDNRFDDIIKGKVEGYEDSSFDPSALAAFHNRMATDAGWPWYVRYRTELTAATASAVVILFTWFGQQYFSGQRTEEWRDGLGTLKAQNEKLNELMREMKNAKSPTPISDTIRIIEFRESDPYLYAKLLRQIDALKISLSDSIRAASYKNGNEPLALNTTTNRQAYTGFFENQFAKYKVGAFALPTEDSSMLEKRMADQATNKLSTKEIIKNEKYRKGVGFRLGPTADISRGFYRAGDDEIEISYGLLGDIIFSPSLSLETGFKFTHRFYTVPENNLNKISLPFVNQTIGDIKLAEIDSWILEVPVNMKYRLPVSPKASVLFRIGYSPMIYTAQTLEYSYEYDATNNLYLKDSHRNKDIHLYAGSANFSVGANRQLKNKKIIELGVFYQQGLGDIGIEKSKSNIVGLRSVYWFPLR